MPAWNGTTGGINQAQAQAACEAAIAAAGLPDATQVETAAETAASAAITSAGLPDASGVTAACAVAITSEAGSGIPSVAQIQSGLATAASIAALNNLSQAQAQTAAAAAITAASLATSAQVSALNDLSQSQAKTACASAITGASGTDIPNTTQITLACQDAINNLGGLPDAHEIARAVKGQAVSSTPLRATVTASGAATSGTLLAAPGLGLRNYVVAVLVSCTAAQSTFQLTSTGALLTMGQHSILQNSNLFCCPPFGMPLMVGGSGAAISWNKTTAATLVIEVWYYQAA